jgi:hypothetical protein
MASDSLAILVPAWGRREAFSAALAESFGVLVASCTELVLCLDPESYDEMGSLIRALARRSRPAATVKTIVLDERPRSKGAALNAAFGETSAAMVMCMDCDIVPTLETIRELQVTATAGFVAHLGQVIRRGPAKSSVRSRVEAIKTTVEVVRDDGRTASVVRSAIFPNENARGAPGVVCLPRDVFLAAGGFNGNLGGYGWEDVDFILRAALIGDTRVAAVGRAEEISPLLSRDDLEGRLLSESRNYERCVADYCLGKLVGTLMQDEKITYISRVLWSGAVANERARC